ncbi:hypothetical protein NSTCB13_05451 [Nostoc sp. DSM 114160]|jgi:hypothetical protein
MKEICYFVKHPEKFFRMFVAIFETATEDISQGSCALKRRTD